MGLHTPGKGAFYGREALISTPEWVNIRVKLVQGRGSGQVRALHGLMTKKCFLMQLMV